jgi:hypothetical protein
MSFFVEFTPLEKGLQARTAYSPRGLAPANAIDPDRFRAARFSSSGAQVCEQPLSQTRQAA